MMITKIEDYFAKGCGRCNRFDTPDCSTKLWLDGLLELRQICLDEGLTEEVKWGQPCYTHAGRNIAIFGALRNDFRLSFFDAALLKDEEKVLEPAGPNSKTPGLIRFLSNDQVKTLEPTIRAYIAEAIEYAEKGIKPVKQQHELEIPAELSDALDADPELAEAFHALTPGRQKSYAINLNSAKKSETRVARIVKFRPKILGGKGALER